MSFVSVIMPYFKKKEYVEKSILSVINQSYKNLELIIIYDDESMEDFEYTKWLDPAGVPCYTKDEARSYE